MMRFPTAFLALSLTLPLFSGLTQAEETGAHCLGHVPPGVPVASIAFDAAGACPSDVLTRDGLVFLRWDEAEAGTRTIEAVLVTAGDRRIVWRDHVSGPGFAAIGALELGPEGANGWPDLHMTLTALPDPDAKTPSRPGPPMTRRYRFDGEAYQPF